MRIIKQNTREFPSFYSTLVTNNSKPKRKTIIEEKPVQSDNKHEELFETLYTYGRKIRETNNISLINDYLKTSLKKFLDISEIVLFHRQKEDIVPAPITKGFQQSTLNFVSIISEDGMLHKILNRGSIAIIPTRDKNSDINSNFLIYPIIDVDRANQFFLLINTSEKHFESGTFKRKVLQSFIQMYVPRVEYLLQKQDLNQTYDELQVYQSKISNDFKLSAIGEMTYSMINQIISPMQVVLSCVDILENKNGGNDKIVNTIKTQVKKVQSITDKIAKFSNDEQARLSVLPCSLNAFINKFHDFIKTSLNKNNYELLLDLETNLPPILSTPNYIQQILTNIFSLMVSTSDTGGIYLQTKYFNNNVILRIISTDHTNIKSEDNRDFGKNINLMMLESLMKRHEGTVKFNSDANNGSSLELIFPLKRKLLK